MNIVAFIAWFTIAISILILLAGREGIERGVVNYDYRAGVPITVDVLYDIGVTLVFVWFGWFITATFYAVHVLLIYNFKKEVGEIVQQRKLDLERSIK